MNAGGQVVYLNLSSARKRTVRIARGATTTLLVTATFWALIAFSIWQSNNSGGDSRSTEEVSELAGHSCVIALLVMALSVLSLLVARQNAVPSFVIAALAWATVSMNVTLWTDVDTSPPILILIVLLAGAAGGSILQGTAAWMLHQQHLDPR